MLKKGDKMDPSIAEKGPSARPEIQFSMHLNANYSITAPHLALRRRKNHGLARGDRGYAVFYFMRRLADC